MADLQRGIWHCVECWEFHPQLWHWASKWYMSSGNGHVIIIYAVLILPLFTHLHCTALCIWEAKIDFYYHFFVDFGRNSCDIFVSHDFVNILLMQGGRCGIYGANCPEWVISMEVYGFVSNFTFSLVFIPSFSCCCCQWKHSIWQSLRRNGHRKKFGG